MMESKVCDSCKSTYASDSGACPACTSGTKKILMLFCFCALIASIGGLALVAHFQNVAAETPINPSLPVVLTLT
jgi:hypothetical protein